MKLDLSETPSITTFFICAVLWLSVFILLVTDYRRMNFENKYAIETARFAEYRSKYTSQIKFQKTHFAEGVNHLYEKLKAKKIESVNKRIAQLQPKLDPALRNTVTNLIMKHSEKHKIPPSLVVHLTHRESGFDPMARSKIGAIGLMQINPKAHPDLVREVGEDGLYHVDNNIAYGCCILANCIERSDTLTGALKKYVGGNVDGYINDIFRLMAEYELSRGREKGNGSL